jgi:hypothetical protein
MTIDYGSCGFGYIDASRFPNFHVGALADTHPSYSGSCGCAARAHRLAPAAQAWLPSCCTHPAQLSGPRQPQPAPPDPAPAGAASR